ncbi:MAG: hypothetical protein AAGU27_03455 [Dehalobacterium sp.]
MKSAGRRFFYPGKYLKIGPIVSLTFYCWFVNIVFAVSKAFHLWWMWRSG